MTEATIPLWTQSAVEAVKWACGVKFVMGDIVKVLQGQVLAWAKRELDDGEELPSEIHEQLKNAALYNDSLEARGLQRQSVRTFVVLGKWREAPIPRKVTKAVVDQVERDMLTAEAREQRDQAWYRYLQEKHLCEAPHLPFGEWRRQHNRRIDLWHDHCAKNPGVPKLPIPPLVGEELDIDWRLTRKPEPGPLMAQAAIESLPLPPSPVTLDELVSAL